MKFKVGDRAVVGVGCEKGNLIEIVSAERKSYTYKTIIGDASETLSRPHFGEDSLFGQTLELCGESKIVITSDGTTTLAKLFEGSKVIKSAEAKCAPSDTYSFELGANLAYNRLVFGTDYNAAEVKFDKAPTKPEPPKHEYKVGQTVKFTGGCSCCENTVAKIIKVLAGAGYDGENLYEVDSGKGYPHNTWHASCVEPYTEPKQEPIKLYCVTSDGFWTEGKIYTIEPDGTLMLEKGYEDHHQDFADVLRVHPQLTGKIFPLVSRPAKVGEWVYVTGDKTETGATHRYELEKAYKVYDKCHEHDSVWFGADGKSNVAVTEYLVLDGYTEPEKPKLWNGKVICTKTNNAGLTARKIYDIKDGYLPWNGSGKTDRRFANIAELNAWDWFYPGTQFIEYLGEA